MTQWEAWVYERSAPSWSNFSWLVMGNRQVSGISSAHKFILSHKIEWNGWRDKKNPFDLCDFQQTTDASVAIRPSLNQNEVCLKLLLPKALEVWSFHKLNTSYKGPVILNKGTPQKWRSCSSKWTKQVDQSFISKVTIVLKTTSL